MPLVALRSASEAKLSSNCQLFLHLVRGFAAQLVVIGHAGSIWGVIAFLEPPHAPYMQNIAVLAFFVVSGLVIPYSILQKRGPNYSFVHYFRNRFARIYCALIPALIFVMAVDIAMIWLIGEFENSEKVNLRNFVSSLLLTATYPLPLPGNGTLFGTLRPLWTLVVEWWIYIAFGAILTGPRMIAPWLLALFSVPVLVVNLVGGEGHGLVLIWAIGSLALWPISRIAVPPKLLLLSAGVLVIGAVALLEIPRTYSLSLNLVLTGAVLAVIWASNNADWRLAGRPIHFFADYSFTLYLVHYTIIVHGFAVLKVGRWEGFLITVLGSNIVAWALSFAGERRYREMQKWLGR